jgi:SNF2 family DNA or RNA helicase
MLVADPGLGKTGITLSALDLLKIAGSNFFPALVLAPKRVADIVWTNEVAKWDAFQGLKVEKIMGEAELRRSVLKKAVADIYVMNYDLVPWLTSLFPFEKWPFKIVIADESSRLKGFRINKGRVRAAALGDIAKFTGRWWNLTGTPCPNGLQDLWGQMYFVDFGERLKRSYTAYLEAFFVENQYTRHVSTQFGAEAEIHKLVADRMLALRAEDWLDVQQPQEIGIDVTLPPSVMAQYREMEKNYFLTLTEREIETAIEAGTAAVKSFKLLQLCSGSIFDENAMPHAVHDAKLEGLEDILEQISPKPLLVSYWWTFDVPRILGAMQKAGISCRVYKGKKDEDDWNAGKIRVLLLHAQSAFGLSLHQVCHDICFYSYNWNAELWQQMIERVGPARQAQLGLKRVVRVWTIRAVGTIEGDVIDSNTCKISIEQALKRARARRKVDE